MTSGQPQTMNPREEIIALLRGQVACPVISALGELGWLDTMVEGSFNQDSFAQSIDVAVFHSVMGYLAALQLIETHEQAGGYRATELGRKVLRRYGTFCILNSYESYMQSLPDLLVANCVVRPQVHRARNVIGSGAIHARKFFQSALDMLDGHGFQLIADIGCGDGKFLSSCKRLYPQARLLAIDLSPVAVEQTLHRIRGESKNCQIEGVVSDGAEIDRWAAFIPPAANRPGAVLISCWFLIHEISRGSTRVVLDFFMKLHDLCPGATLLVGEVVRLPQETMVMNRTVSILPELTLLHDLSRQGLLDWEQWRQVAADMPYEIVNERHFDVVSTNSGERVPSSFVWCLQPRRPG